MRRDPCTASEKGHLVLEVNAKCSDMCVVTLNGKDKNGYVPSGLGIGGGDYIEFKLCLLCGRVLGNTFPVPQADIDEAFEE